MELKELVSKLEECHEALEKMGCYGGFLFDGGRHGGKMCVHTDNEHLPNGKTFYDTSVYADAVVKNVVVGNIAFFAILPLEEAYKEGVQDFWGVLN